MQPLHYILLMCAVLAGGLSFFLIRKPRPYLLKLSLSFSGAFLFAISVLHLIPEVYEGSVKNIGAWVMIGFFLQIILEFFSQGIEHGHMHVHHHNNAFPGGMMISLCLHSFLEAMPLTMKAGAVDGHDHDSSLLSGIMLHHLPVAFALVSMLIASGTSQRNTILFLLLFAVMGPLGAFTGDLMGNGMSVDFDIWYKRIMAIVIGIFLHISTTILFESSSDHRFNLYKMIAIVSGGVIGFIASSGYSLQFTVYSLQFVPIWIIVCF